MSEKEKCQILSIVRRLKNITLEDLETGDAIRTIREAIDSLLYITKDETIN